ncbi:MAG TPA: DUF6785 family protein [Armatimonadota bacterium]|nr:DUF6785 family protein [Armatimonadota bacterium]
MAVSRKAIAVGLVGILLVVFIVSYAELVTGQIMIGFLQLPPVVLALLFVLVLGNRGVAGIRRKWALNPAEMAVVYVMMLISAMVSSRGVMEDLIPMLAGPNYLANVSNNWAKLYFPHIKPWLVPWNPNGPAEQWITQRFYEGLRFGESLPWKQWLAPLLVWTLLIGLVFYAFICLSVILRKQWVDNEKLNFPLVQLPLEMITERSERGFLHNPIMWAGFAVPFCYFGMNGLHNIDPAIPSLPIFFAVSDLFTSRPWNAVSFWRAYFSMAGVGFFFLLPTDLLFSLWFFYILGHLQEVTGAALGYAPIPYTNAEGSAFVAYQAAGAWLALSVYLFLLARPHLKSVWAHAIGRISGGDEHEVMPYRYAVWGLAAAMIGIVAWGVAIGMTWWVVLGEFGVFIFVEALIMTRAVAEGGVIMAEGVMTPMDLYTLISPASSLGANNLTGLSFFDALFTRDLRGLTLTGFLDAQKLADGVGLERRKLLGVFILTLAVAMIASAALQLWLPYHFAAVTMYSYAYRGNNIQFFSQNAHAMAGSVPSTGGQFIWLVLGIGITILLVNLRIRLDWFPFHPLGYALTTSWMTTVFWAPILVAWVLKTLVIRYGGMRLFVRVRPFFLGLVFGEFTAAVFWTLLAAALHVPAPAFPWP